MALEARRAVVRVVRRGAGRGFGRGVGMGILGWGWEGGIFWWCVGGGCVWGRGRCCRCLLERGLWR